MIAKDSAHRHYLFATHDEKDIESAIWRDLKPSADTSPFARSEDDS